MTLLSQSWDYYQQNSDQFWQQFVAHLQLSFLALAIAIVICVPLGILTSRFGTTARVIINIIGILRVVPSLAVLFIMLPLLGLGFLPALVALTLLAFPPVLINTDTGLRGLDPATLEAARGVGMSWWQRLLKVEIPLALPVIIGGIRTAAVEVIASATLAVEIGAGGLGYFIAIGLSGYDNSIMLVGAIPVAVLALLAEIILGVTQRLVSPKTTTRLRAA